MAGLGFLSLGMNLATNRALDLALWLLTIGILGWWLWIIFYKNSNVNLTLKRIVRLMRVIIIANLLTVGFLISGCKKSATPPLADIQTEYEGVKMLEEAAANPTPVIVEPASFTIHIVQQDETWKKIAEKYNITEQALKEANLSIKTLRRGIKLTIPPY